MASSKREKELARMRAERQAARRAAEAARRRRRNLVVVASVVGLLVLGGLGALAVSVLGGDDDGDAIASGPCSWQETGSPSRQVDLPPTDPGTAPQTATITTDRGVIGVALQNDAAPCASASLASLAAQGFYDDTPCHRLTTEGFFVLQCGDPTGTGTGGPGYQFAEENLEGASYPRGTVAMAKGAAPGTSGSQFFLVYDDSPLPPDYTPFGRITSGLEVLDAVAAAGAEPAGDGAPVQAVQITSLRTAPLEAAAPTAPAEQPLAPGATPSAS